VLQDNEDKVNYNPSFLMRAALLAFVTLQSSFAVDFTLAVFGSRSVTRGYSTVFTVKPKLTAGKDERAYVNITGLPAGATAEWWFMKLACCGDYVWQITLEQPVQVSVPASAQPGTYPVTVTYTSFSRVSRSVTFPLEVVAEPRAPAPVFPPNIDLDLALWKSNMAKYGTAHCSPVETEIGNEGYAWYYDGSRVYEQIATLLGDDSYVSCAQMFNDAYRKHIEKAKGWIAGWRYFPHGLFMNYTRTRDELSRAAIMTMADGSPWTQDTSVGASLVDPISTRDVAYATSTLVLAERLGRPRSWKLSFLVDSLLAHFERWYVQRNAEPQPFMVALAAEALIDYYELTKDPRVPGVLKIAADGLWTGSWDKVSKSFFYVNFDTKKRAPSNDTNLLIVPLYGWVFQQTGESIYRERGDEIFASGVKTAWLEGGKQFSQNYRWSPKYIDWRQSPSAPAPGPATIAALSGTPQSAKAGAAFASPLAAIVKDKNGSPAAGVNVTFTAPGSGASATFAGAQSSIVKTDAGGVATTPIPVANTTAGTYQILAAVPGLSSASFAMTNNASATVSVTVGSLTFPWNPQGHPVTLSAQIAGNAGRVNGGTVEFRVSGTVVATVAVAKGEASASYTVPATVLPGTHAVEARFSGWDTYPAATGTGSLTIVQRVPAITWPAPANIPEGTPLSSIQLNAKADAAGTFVYSPAAGTVLPPGARQTLRATFTPADPTRYAAATASTQITVDRASKKPADMTPMSAVATRDAATRSVIVTVTFKNMGGPATSTAVTIAALGGVAAAELPVIGPVAESALATTVLRFPATVPTGGGTLLIFTSNRGAALSVSVP
jgi:hypothetical protein